MCRDVHVACHGKNGPPKNGHGAFIFLARLPRSRHAYNIHPLHKMATYTIIRLEMQRLKQASCISERFQVSPVQSYIAMVSARGEFGRLLCLEKWLGGTVTMAYGVML